MWWVLGLAAGLVAGIALGYRCGLATGRAEHRRCHWRARRLAIARELLAFRRAAAASRARAQWYN